MHLRHHDATRVNVVDVLTVGDIRRVGRRKFMPTQNRHALAKAIKTQMRKIGVQVIRERHVRIDHARCIRSPVAVPVVPVLSHLLEAHQIDVKVLNGPSDLPKLVVLVLLLIAMQVQRQNPQRTASRLVIGVVAVIPDNSLIRLALYRILDAIGMLYRHATCPNLPAVPVGIPRNAAARQVPVVRAIETGGHPLRLPLIC